MACHASPVALILFCLCSPGAYPRPAQRDRSAAACHQLHIPCPGPWLAAPHRAKGASLYILRGLRATVAPGIDTANCTCFLPVMGITGNYVGGVYIIVFAWNVSTSCVSESMRLATQQKRGRREQMLEVEARDAGAGGAGLRVTTGREGAPGHAGHGNSSR